MMCCSADAVSRHTRAESGTEWAGKVQSSRRSNRRLIADFEEEENRKNSNRMSVIEGPIMDLNTKDR